MTLQLMASTFRADLEFLAVPALPVSRNLVHSFGACLVIHGTHVHMQEEHMEKSQRSIEFCH